MFSILDFPIVQENRPNGLSNHNVSAKNCKVYGLRELFENYFTESKSPQKFCHVLLSNIANLIDAFSDLSQRFYKTLVSIEHYIFWGTTYIVTQQ